MNNTKLPPLPGDMTSGTFGRVTQAASWFLVTTLMLFLTGIPSILLFAFLDPAEPVAVSNAMILAAALALLGPAISAGMYSARAFSKDEEPAPFKAFWRGYRMNFFDALRIWFPACLMVGLIALAIGAASLSGMRFGIIALLIWGVAVIVWALLALSLATFISMSTGGIARLALLYLGRTWKVTIGIIAILVIAFFITRLPGGILLLAVLSALITALLYQNAKPMIEDATRNYTVNGAAPHDSLE